MIIVGDADRSGSFQSGVGYNMILVNDLAAVDAVIDKLMNTEADLTADYMKHIASNLEQASNYFYQMNLERYY